MPNDDYILRSDALKAILGVSIYDTIEELEGARTIAENTWADGLYDAYKIIEEEVDAADVEPKRETGRWSVIEGKIRRDIDKRIVKCTLCGNYLSMEGVNCGRGDANYCPNCGAKMDKEEDHENHT